MKKTLALAATALLLAGHANAAVMVTGNVTPAEITDGFAVFDIGLESDEGPINGVDATFNGDFNQINPFGLSTIFTNNNGAIDGTGGNSRLDTQFKFGDNVLSIGAAESSTLLQAAITNLGDSNTGMLPLAQIVIPEGSTGDFNFNIEVRGNPNAIPLMGSIGSVLPLDMLVGDPADGSIVDLTNVFLNGGAEAIALSNSGGDFSALGNIDVSLDDNSFFSAALVGESVGLGISVPNPAQFAPGTVLTANLSVDSDNGGSLSYTLQASVPEPASMGLLGLAFVGLIGLRRRS